jgi:hypothetical protein
MGPVLKIERFIKRSFFKMRRINFTKKMKKNIFTHICFKFQKNTSKIVSFGFVKN